MKEKEKLFELIPLLTAYAIGETGEILTTPITERKGKKEVPVFQPLFLPVPKWFSDGCRIAKVNLFEIFDQLHLANLHKIQIEIDGRICECSRFMTSSAIKDGFILVSLNDQTDQYIDDFMKTADDRRSICRGSLAFPFPQKGGSFTHENIDLFCLPLGSRIFGGLTQAQAQEVLDGLIDVNICKKWETKLIDGSSIIDNALIPFLKFWQWKKGKAQGCDFANDLDDLSPEELDAMTVNTDDRVLSVMFGSGAKNRENMIIKDEYGREFALYSDVSIKNKLIDRLKRTKKGRKLYAQHPYFLENYAAEFAEQIDKIVTGGNIQPLYDGIYGGLFVASTHTGTELSTVKEPRQNALMLRHPLIGRSSYQVVDLISDVLGNIPARSVQIRNNIDNGKAFDKAFCSCFNFDGLFAVAILPDGRKIMISPRSFVECVESVKIGKANLKEHQKCKIDFHVIATIDGQECFAIPDKTARKDKSLDADDLIGLFELPDLILEKVKAQADEAQADKATKKAGKIPLTVNADRVERQAIRAGVLSSRAVSVCHRGKNYLALFSNTKKANEKETPRERECKRLFKCSLATFNRMNPANWQNALDASKAFDVFLQDTLQFIQNAEKALTLATLDFFNNSPKKAQRGKTDKRFLDGRLPKFAAFGFTSEMGGNVPRIVKANLEKIADLEWENRTVKELDFFVNYFCTSEREPLRIAKNLIAAYYEGVKRVNLARVKDESGEIQDAFLEYNREFLQGKFQGYLDELVRLSGGKADTAKAKQDLIAACWNVSHQNYDGSFCFQVFPAWIESQMND